MSYDYGKSFKKISEKFSFGGENSSEVAIAQFYHSPADNKRVRRMRQLAPAGFPRRAAPLYRHQQRQHEALGAGPVMPRWP